jgi:hypothetical protein
LIEAASLLEIAAVAGLLEQLRIDLQVDCGRPTNRRSVGCENVLAERQLEAMQQTPQPRPYDLFGAFRPKHGCKDFAPHGPRCFRQIDQQG